jgi:mannose/cellobiose epimerase-like protein (N-acyl-D-glucosamine 2-epimerase family)
MTESLSADINNIAGDPLVECAREGLGWLLDFAAPLWAPSAYRFGQLFPERMSVEGAPQECPHRLFVQARQVYSFCVIGRAGWNGPWREYVRQGVELLVNRGRRPDGLYIHKFALDGGRFDSRADLYDQAFTLLALAHAGSALRREEFFAIAEALDDTLEEKWRLPHGGYFEGELAECPPFRQNPHMHLLEAFIALYEGTGADRWRVRAQHLTNLCAKFFVDSRSGALLEYFDERLQPLDGPEGRVVEPGHCFEWAWLFEVSASWLGPEAIRLSDGLTSFARRFGIDQDRGVAFNEVSKDGTALNRDARLWPQTERLKAALARFRRLGDTVEKSEAALAYKGLVKYFDTPKRGAWRDKLRADGSWAVEPAPGSSLYHISCALAELEKTVRG